MDRTWNVRKERVKGDHKIFGTAEVWSCHLLRFGRQEESRMTVACVGFYTSEGAISTSDKKVASNYAGLVINHR